MEPKETNKGIDFKRYLGDGVYADYDGYHIVLTTEDGLGISNTILLEPIVRSALTNYMTSLKDYLNDKS